MGIIAPPVNGYHVGVKDLPPAVRPRERLQARGASDLSDAELLAIIVRTGTSSCNTLELSTRALARHGGLAGVDRAALGELFREAVRQSVASIVLVHNHPSGDPTPSPEDVRLTCDAVQAGNLLDIPLLDHVVIRHGRFTSLKERGLGFAT
jgi:DNA repair protein RadC